MGEVGSERIRQEEHKVVVAKDSVSIRQGEINKAGALSSGSLRK